MADSYRFTAEEAGERLDLFVCGKLPELSRSRIQKLLADGALTVNGRGEKAGYKLRAGDLVELCVPDVKPMEVAPKEMDLKVIWEDADLAVVSKPRGLVVHPAAGHEDDTLVNGLLYRFEGELSGINGVMRPGIVHRIDKDTSGLLVVCKSDAAHQGMSELLRTHDITREYRAVVYGNLKDDRGTVNAPVGRMDKDRKKMCVRWDGKEAVTHYEVLERFGEFTYVACRLETGRTHQIRVHMKHLGHPLLGDPLYGPENPRSAVVKRLRSLPGGLLDGQILHAGLLGFVHPITGEYLEFREELPEYFETVLAELRKN